MGGFVRLSAPRRCVASTGLRAARRRAAAGPARAARAQAGQI